MTQETTGRCWGCAAQLGPLDFGHRESCPQCGRATRVCRNCAFFEWGLYNDCREPQAERVVDKEAGNRCDYFKPGDGDSDGAAERERQAAQAAADAFFKK